MNDIEVNNIEANDGEAKWLLMTNNKWPMTNIYGLIGKKLEHSFSPDYFSRKFRKLKLDADYRLFEMDNISKLPEIIQENKNIRGLNVTIPYKKEVLQFLDKVDNVAQEIGSVNTVKIDRL